MPDPQHSNSTSTSLINRIIDNDEDSWCQLVDTYGRLVYFWCQRAGVELSEVSDISQEVFQAVFCGINSFRKDRKLGTFRGWLWTITRNKLVDHINKKMRQATGEGGTAAQARFQELPEAEPYDEEDAVYHKQNQDLIYRLLKLVRGDFEQQTWKAFQLTSIDRLNSREAAELLGITPNAVRHAKARVLRRLREELGDRFEI